MKKHYDFGKMKGEKNPYMTILRAKVLDATHLELLKPIPEPMGRDIVISVADANSTDVSQEQWLTLSRQSLSRAYSDLEPEYTPSMVRERNPEYNT